MSNETTPDADIQRQLDAYLAETATTYYYNVKPGDFETGKAILTAAPETQVAVVMVLDRAIEPEWNRRYRLEGLFDALVRRKLPFTTAQLERLLTRASPLVHGTVGLIMPHIRRYLDAGNPLTDGMRQSLKRIVESLSLYDATRNRKLRVVIEEIMGEGEAPETLPDPGDAWSDLAIADVATMEKAHQQAWHRLFHTAQTADGSKPAKSYHEAARPQVAALGKTFAPTVARWLSAVNVPQAQIHNKVHNYHAGGQTTIHEYSFTTYSTDKNIGILKGLAWACAGEKSPEVARALSEMVEGALKKVPGVGPWGVRAANAAVWALSEMPCPEAVPELVRLRNRVRYRPTMKAVENAIEAVARRAGMPREELEDLSVPTYGLDMDGTGREEFGDCAATVRLTPEGKVEAQWYGANGKPVKSVPASVRQDHADDLKEFKASVDGLSKMLTVQRDRLERTLFPVREWSLGKWRERYLGQPLLGHLTRRLLWRVTDGERMVIVLPVGDGLTDENGATVEGFSDEATIRLFHPLNVSVETILRWREALEARGIVQPFKQVHREVYILTDAEVNTGTYSNRYAGHILKQHQFNSLCALRGWKNQLRLMVDDSYPPATLELPAHNLRAEFWVEGVGDNYGTDTNDTGTYLYLSTDQVRFYPLDAAQNSAHAGGGGYDVAIQWDRVDGTYVRRHVENTPIPLVEIPPLVLSEVLRDVDLFVGVASVGNDPTWADGGPNGRHRDYWHDYSFGELTATAQTRGEVLARLLPRLKIAARTRIEGRFLYVRGDLKTYKIHLGSGNILMEPNDHYLCIVEGRSAETAATPLFLPFEGDSRLSLILSKAFLLAEDTKITDPTIVRQIK